MDFYITRGPDRNHAGNEPFTETFGFCGKKGEYVHLTDKFMTDDAIAARHGPREKVIVLELYFKQINFVYIVVCQQNCGPKL